MEKDQRYKIEPGHRSTGEPVSAESLKGVYQRHFQGAWVRSGASAFMWIFAVIAYNLKTIDGFAFAGITSAVLYLILINPPTLWILKRIRHKKIVAATALSIHFLEILGYTAIIYFAGGLGRGYLTLLYPALITYFVETINTFLSHPGTRVGTASPGFYQHKKRILIVDDDPLNVKLLSAKLPADQYEVLPAFSGKEALQRTVRENPDLILLDIMMPEMDGYEVSHWLKTNPSTEGIPIILVTALDGTEDRIRGFESGADEFLNKPVNDIELLTRMNSLLRLKRYREQLLSRTLSEKGFSTDPTPSDPTEIPAHPARILLVEDNPKDTLLFRNMFAGEPYQLEAVKTGEEALERVQQYPFDLVLLDVLLPGQDGFEVCQQLKGLHQTQDMQIVLITCLPDLENKVRGVELGADDYLIKPVNQRELKARVKVLLKKKRYLDQLRNNFERAVNSAIYDGLTGLHNQTYFKKFLELEIKRAERQRYPLGLMIVDLDDFKKVNDQLGHLTGDLILKELAQLVKHNVREIDLSARYGGDEFVVVLPYTDPVEVVQIAERIQYALANWSNLEENPLGRDPITVSIGVAFYPEHGATLEELIRKADSALYRAKKEGKNRYCCLGREEAA